GYVDPKTAKQRGHQIGADWLISGHITAIKQPVGRQEVVYYKTTLEATDLDTSAIIWADEVEVKKLFKKRRIRP
ncbi:MAG: penicillin-binding protein activator LpoB, partial [bacterium]|nr:penicillin-binding protein activator LpoB [bacterium]